MFCGNLFDSLLCGLGTQLICASQLYRTIMDHNICAYGTSMYQLCTPSSQSSASEILTYNKRRNIVVFAGLLAYMKL